MKICTEEDYLRAHITLIEKAPCGQGPTLPKFKQRLDSIRITLKLDPDDQQDGPTLTIRPFENR
jgi:hypothetical protein